MGSCMMSCRGHVGLSIHSFAAVFVGREVGEGGICLLPARSVGRPLLFEFWAALAMVKPLDG